MCQLLKTLTRKNENLKYRRESSQNMEKKVKKREGEEYIIDYGQEINWYFAIFPPTPRQCRGATR